ncbi:hypothetical protein [Streptomyces sp. NPDC026673]|uniref:hypothetical protein n=1 Tax=Streptomyces sp. NPDC026673 TaxID=3155724 RepID=UPI0033C3245C
MRRARGVIRRGLVAAAVLASVLAAEGCSADSEPTGSPTTGSTDTMASPSWEFEHVFDFHGRLADLAALAEDDIWAVAIENNGDSSRPLLHFDGTRWQRGPLPETFGTTDSPLVLHEVGESALWLEWHSPGTDTDVNSWALWDGVRWSAVPNPPPGRVERLAAAGPEDIWVLLGNDTAQHWDGTRWTASRLPYAASDLAVAGPDDVWAVGGRSTGPGTEQGSGERYSQPASMHWDGTSWKPVRTPQARFAEPIPPEAGASLNRVIALDSGEVLAYGMNSFNHGEGGEEPADEFIQLRWDGSQWVAQQPAPGGCARRIPVAQDDTGLFLHGNWFLTGDGRCVKIKRHRLPLSTGARKGSNQSLWLAEVHRIPGTDEWLGAGHVQVNQSGDPFGAPVVVRLKRGR